MDATNIASICVAVIAALAAWASQRSAAKAAKDTSRFDAEKDAYTRARAIDTETINRLKTEVDEVRADNQTLHHDLEEANSQIGILRLRIAALERGHS